MYTLQAVACSSGVLLKKNGWKKLARRKKKPHQLMFVVRVGHCADMWQLLSLSLCCCCPHHCCCPRHCCCPLVAVSLVVVVVVVPVIPSHLSLCFLSSLLFFILPILCLCCSLSQPFIIPAMCHPCYLSFVDLNFTLPHRVLEDSQNSQCCPALRLL